MEEGSLRKPTTATPQGGVISPLLANIYLDMLDEAWERDGSHLGRLVRYADDILILCGSRAGAENALRVAQSYLEGKLKLTVNATKTHIAHSDEGVKFLGVVIHMNYTRIQDKKVTPPPRARIDESMEALIHHFKIFTEGFKVPAGEAYRAVESPRGELGCYIASDGGAKPYRMHIRGPSFVNLQTLPHMMRDGLIADAVVNISSVDPIMGEVDR